MTSSDWWNIEWYIKSDTKDLDLLRTPILAQFYVTTHHMVSCNW